MMKFTKPIRKKMYRQAVDKWGLQLQLGMLMEECAELIQATHKVIRKGDMHNNSIRQLASEMADVEIMIEQIKTVMDYMCVTEKVETEKYDKLLRLKEMLK